MYGASTNILTIGSQNDIFKEVTDWCSARYNKNNFQAILHLFYCWYQQSDRKNAFRKETCTMLQETLLTNNQAKESSNFIVPKTSSQQDWVGCHGPHWSQTRGLRSLGSQDQAKLH